MYQDFLATSWKYIKISCQQVVQWDQQLLGCKWCCLGCLLALWCRIPLPAPSLFPPAQQITKTPSLVYLECYGAHNTTQEFPVKCYYSVEGVGSKIWECSLRGDFFLRRQCQLLPHYLTHFVHCLLLCLHHQPIHSCSCMHLPTHNHTHKYLSIYLTAQVIWSRDVLIWGKPP